MISIPLHNQSWKRNVIIVNPCKHLHSYNTHFFFFSSKDKATAIHTFSINKYVLNDLKQKNRVVILFF